MRTKTLVKNCPFCRKVYEQRSYISWGKDPLDEERWLFGTPLVLCPNCGKLFIDKDRQELAITGPRRQDTAVIGPASIRLGLLGAVLGAIFLIAGQTALGLIALCVAAATLAADAALFPTRRRKLENERIASEKRLSDPEYALALKRAGYEIPEKYLNGVGPG